VALSDCPRAAQSGRGYLVSCLVTARRLLGAADWCNGIPDRGCAAYYFGIRDDVLERPYSTGSAQDLYVGRFLVRHALECDFPRGGYRWSSGICSRGCHGSADQPSRDRVFAATNVPRQMGELAESAAGIHRGSSCAAVANSGVAVGVALDLPTGLRLSSELGVCREKSLK
jgi:hypothetical protein